MKTDFAGSFVEKIAAKKAVVGVMGLGYVGLPLAMGFVRAGFHVLGFDVDPEKITELEAGRSYIPGIETADVAKARKAGTLRATSDFARLAEADALIIAVPTPVTPQKDPDLIYVEQTARSIAKTLRKGQLVVLESTTYPGTTDEIVKPILEATGLHAGTDYFLAYSPEREDPGVKGHSLGQIPKVVGGHDPASARAAEALYAAVAPKIVMVSTMRAAEAAKILENIYRAVNIALVNELKILFDRMGIDVWEVIDAASTKPFGFQRFTPGPGWGGHCLEASQWVRIRGEGLDGCYRIGELFDRLKSDHDVALTRRGAYLRPTGLESLSLDAKSGEVRWAPVSTLYRARYSGRAVALRTDDNRTLTVTDGHPMLAWREGRFHAVAAAQLKAGDALPVATHQGEPAADPVIDLLTIVPADQRHRVWVRPSAGTWADHAATLKRHFGWEIRDSIRGNVLRLDRFLVAEGDLGLDRASVVLLTGMGCARRSWPASLVVTPAFARFVGYYLAEGCISGGTARPVVRLTFNRDEREYLADVESILADGGFAVSRYDDRKWHSTTLKASSLILAWLLGDTWRCGRRSTEMRIPDAIFGASPEHRREVLAGLMRGDGDVWTRTGPRRYTKRGRTYQHRDATAIAGFFSSSPALLEQVALLLQASGFRPTFRPGGRHLRVYGGAAVGPLAEIFGGAKKRRLQDVLAARRRVGRGRSTRVERSADLFTTPVREVTPRTLDGFVYSLEVEGTRSFATNTGLVVHNCIPVDPFYLSWKAREYGTPTRFIELAGEINDKLAFWVTGKVVEALNDRSKALKGAKVLMLGLAYKKDVNDVRESPAFPLAEQLRQRGAVLSYHDPHVTKLPKMRHWPNLTIPRVELTAKTLAAHDVALIVTDHTAVDYALVVKHAPLVVDTRNATKDVREGREKIVKA